MPRLRTTTGLSALACAVGIAGTAWLSAQSGGGGLRPAATVTTVPVRAAPEASPSTGPDVRPARRVRRSLAAAGKLRPASPEAGPMRHAPPVAAPEGPVPPRVLRPPFVIGALDAVPAPPPPRAVALVPVSMPQGTALSWVRLRGHLDGRVVLHVDVDAAGEVRAARIARSSGDEVLDAEALRSVWLWRFAVPDDVRGGASGDVPVRYVAAR